METKSLAGKWRFALDADDAGINERWFERKLPQTAKLPGSTDENGYGEPVTGCDTHRLSRIKKYIGCAWYQRTVNIPAAWAGKHMTLFLERCLWESMLWIDGELIGYADSICTPHTYTCNLEPGKHVLTIRVDNRAKFNIGTRSHAWSEDVQTIWNGIVGRIELIATDSVYMDHIQVYPDVWQNTVRVQLELVNLLCVPAAGSICMKAVCGEQHGAQAEIPFSLDAGHKTVEVILSLQQPAMLWDEISPSMYTLQLALKAEGGGKQFCDSQSIAFGMRSFQARGGQFFINGRAVFLRGTHDAGNFPLTGYPSCSVADWKRIYQIGKSYGLNHFRFHSFCPPEAAFTAADEEGVILQAELPLFSISAPPIGEDKARDDFLEAELIRILRSYGNHPSFCLMCMGNELRGDYRYLEKLVAYGKKTDERHLYSASANNACEPSVGIKPSRGDEYYVSHEACIGEKRLLRRCEHIFRQSEPNTSGDYGDTLVGIDVPTISHEVGQWEVYPCMDEPEKYTGVLRAKNFEYFRNLLFEKGMLAQAHDFTAASGRLAVALYKEEIERSLRTSNYGGFQLLDIHDYPGQGTSTVGWLDAFWDTKGLISPEEFRGFCGDVVPLVRMEKRVWANDELFTARLEVSNYGAGDVQDTVAWELRDTQGSLIAHGDFPPVCFVQGKVTTVGDICAALDTVLDASKLILTVKIIGKGICNKWDIWRYPSVLDIPVPENTLLATQWDHSVEQALHEGRQVLLLAENVSASEAMAFTPPFWNTQLFVGQAKSMGIWCDPAHPALSQFPTDFYANWQWWYLLAKARCVNIEALGREFSPIVQVIDHPLRNAKMALLFEARVGNGRLLYSSLPLSDHSLVARQLLYSLCVYMRSNRFSPSCAVDMQALRSLLKPLPALRLKRYLKRLEADSATWDCPVSNLLEGDGGRCWVSMPSGFPHSIFIELHQTMGIDGLQILPRQDGVKSGFVKEFAIYVGNDPENMGKPVLTGTMEYSLSQQQFLFPWMDDGFNKTKTKVGRYIKFVALSGYGNCQELALAGIDILC